jgi:hypothetical protein
MAETIKAIREVSNVKASGKTEYSCSTFDGYEVETTEQVIRLLIVNESQCCERWGYFLSEDDWRGFIGAELRDVKRVGTELMSDSLKNETGGYGLDDGAAMFINLETDRGVLQFTAYNAHNGYYGHNARVESRQLAVEERL